MTKKHNPVIEVAEEMQSDDDDITTLSTGVRVRLRPVSIKTITKVTSLIKPPDVPVWRNEAKGREERNPNDPGYKLKVQLYEQERGEAVMDAMVMFGVKLVDGLPEDDTWIEELEFINITFDKDKPVQREFHYKAYIALESPGDWSLVTAASGVSQEDIAQAEASFRGDEGQDAD